MNTTQEPKYEIHHGSIRNRQSQEVIPADEPLMIFRARDKHAANAIAFYFRGLMNDEHRKAVGLRLTQFNEWADANPEKMKEEPDTQLTADWPGYQP